MATESCSLCGVDRREHEAMEKAGAKNHKWSGVGGSLQALPVAKPKPDGSRSVSGPFQAPPGDPILRLLLINKGLISAGELDELQAVLVSTGMAVASPPRPTRGSSDEDN